MLNRKIIHSIQLLRNKSINWDFFFPLLSWETLLVNQTWLHSSISQQSQAFVWWKEGLSPKQAPSKMGFPSSSVKNPPIFWMLSVKPAFSLSSFTLIKRLFSSSSLFAIRVVSSAYLRLLIFLLAVLIPPCASSSPALHMMYSAYKLSKQGDNIQPWRTPFPIWNQSFLSRSSLAVALDLHTDFSGHLVFPSLQEFSTVCCDLHRNNYMSRCVRPNKPYLKEMFL